MRITNIAFLILALSIISCKTAKYPNLENGLYADLQTNKGDILVQLEYKKTPITVANFVSLAEGNNPYVSKEFKNKRFYDGIKFHRVVKDFMIQGGDPSGSGVGSPGYKFEDEFPQTADGKLVLSHDDAGILSMANSGPNSNGSQFFITHKETQYLDGRHTVFGHVVIGQEVVDTIQQNDIIEKMEIIRVGKEAKEFDAPTEFETYFKKIEEEKKLHEEKLKEAKANFLEFIIENEASATKLPSGLKIISIKSGGGGKPDFGSKVLVNYSGFLKNGDLFDSNILDVVKLYEKYDPKRDKIGGYNPTPMDYSSDAKLIAGFKEGLLQMKIGDKVLLIIPSHLGYGNQVIGNGLIPANSDLIFELEIVDQAD